MEEFNISSKNNQIILALGAESAGNFSIFKNGKIYFSEDFGDLSKDTNFKEYSRKLNEFLKKEKIKPGIILSDLHPLFRTTVLAEKLSKKYGAQYLPVQHHLAHIFSSVGDFMLTAKSEKLEDDFIGIACDGTGYGFDEKIWGGELFKFKISNLKFQTDRIGHLENQILLGGEIAIKEPARILISVFSKFLEKDEVYKHVKRYYSKQEFEVLYSQLQQNFNCLETSSTARILDAVSVLLGFSKNERLSKHGPVEILEKNSTTSYEIKPQIIYDEREKMWVLQTTPLFEYLIKNLGKDKKRLAATAQKYIADGLVKIVNKLQTKEIYFAGGMANNRILSHILENVGIYTSKKIPRGDAGISVGQIFYYILANSGD
jgi:hydrogenase maturation protein HypF